MVDTGGKCVKCSKKTEVLRPGLKCMNCKGVYHGDCLFPPVDVKEMLSFTQQGWLCKKCHRAQEREILKSRTIKQEINENKRQIDINDELKALLELAELSLDQLLEKHHKLTTLNKILDHENLILSRRLAKLDGSYKMKVDFLHKLTQRKPAKTKTEYIENALKLAQARHQGTGDGDNITKDFHTFAKYAGLNKHEKMAYTIQGKIKKMSKSWLTHLFLFIFLIIYTCVGALIFHLLERNPLVVEPLEKTALTSEYSAKVINHIDKFGTFDSSKQVGDYQKQEFKEFKEFEGKTRKRFDYELKVDRGEDEMNWGFYSSIFFCSTVYTTIGYGHLYPITLWGQITVIIYATIGVPLFVITLADFGALLTRCLKYLWNLWRRVYYTGKWKKQNMDEKGNIDDTGNNQNFVEDKLPVYVAMLVLIIYLLIGAVIFNFLEGWKLLDAIYFLFISITTVGYGDFIPKLQWYMVLVMLFLFLGLAIGTMAVNVVREKLIDTMDKASAKLGHTLDIYIDELYEKY